MKFSRFTYLLPLFLLSIAYTGFGPGCAQIGAPTGGSKDTTAPVLLKAVPENGSVNVRGNKVVLSFDEFIEVRDAPGNLVVSPLTKNLPNVDHKLRTVTVKFRDSLLPNTTYSISFGDAIVDLNEGNPYKNFTYVFSTGNIIDSLSLQGKLIVAETGKADSTIAVMLYRNADDSAVMKRRPDYLVRPDGSGRFRFNNLPADKFKLYALQDGDGGKTYNSKKEVFGFINNDINLSANMAPQEILAYAEEKDAPKGVTPGTPRTVRDKKLRYTVDVTNGPQDLLTDLRVIFNNPVKTWDLSKIVLTDTNYKPITTAKISFDTAANAFIIQNKWTEATTYKLTVDKTAASDTANNVLAKTDTVRFTTKKLTDYGNLVLRFKNLDLSKHPVLQFVQSGEVKKSYPLNSMEWNEKLFAPGEYEIRILLDSNNNGKWDPGNYSKKLQPERVIAIPQRVAIKGNWDNEREIVL